MKWGETADSEPRGVTHKDFRFNLCGLRLQVANCKVEGMGRRSSRTQLRCELRERDGCHKRLAGRLAGIWVVKGLILEQAAVKC